MLCRSLSTGVLSSIVPPLGYSHRFVSLPDGDRCVDSLHHHHQHSHAHVGSTPRSSFPSPGPQHLRSAAEDSRSVERGDWDFGGTNVVPWPTFRKVQSENDLQSLCRSSSSSATFPTADSLLTAPQEQEENADGLFHAEDSVGSHRLTRRSRRSKLREHSSWSVIPSGSAVYLISQLDAVIPEAVESLAEVTSSFRENTSFSRRILNSSALIEMQYMEELVDKSGMVGRQKGSAIQSSGLGPQEFDGSTHTLPREAVFVSSSNTSSSTATMHSGRHGYNFGMGCNTTIGFPVSEVLKRNANSSTHKESLDPMFMTDLRFGNGGDGSGRGVLGGGSGGGYGDSNGIEAQYRKMLEADPGHPLLLRNYARFLHAMKGDPLKAEPYYERAILANPSDGEVLGHYAQLMWELYKDEERASRYFEQALQACPDDCFLNAAYASFLWSSETDEIDESPAGVRHSNTHINMSLMYGIAAAAVSA